MEYTERYDRLHLSWTKLNLYLQFHPRNISEGELTEQPQCMPDYCKKPDTVDAYRNYYLQEKAGFAKWNYTNQPKWWA